MYDFDEIKTKIADAKEWLKKEYQGIRTGRAAPALLDSVIVEAYGTRIPLQQTANIGVENARTLRVIPYNVAQVKEVEKAITAANLGVGVSADEKGVRVSFPELTAERRDMLIKAAKEKLEEARTSLRSARDEVWSDIQKKERDGELTEDDKYRLKDELQKLVDGGNKELDEMFEKKEKEITS
ncbi:MAG: ribosome recycling factor [bacterium]|nr:ribosome recycling factor [bacterium]